MLGQKRFVVFEQLSTMMPSLIDPLISIAPANQKVGQALAF
jgi:hypothetical protein